MSQPWILPLGEPDEGQWNEPILTETTVELMRWVIGSLILQTEKLIAL